MMSALICVLLAMAITGVMAMNITAVEYNFVGQPPALTGPLEQNYILTNAERCKINELEGPESFAFRDGRIYTGLADGRIVDISSYGVRTVTRTGPRECNGELECGRPLGLRFDSQGRLLVADSSYGIFRVNVDTGDKQLVFSSKTIVDGEENKFINDVLEAKDGTLYFTTSSTKWNGFNAIYSILEGEASGRLLAYNKKSNNVTVLAKNLAFANGIEFGPYERYILISELSGLRISKLSLKPGRTYMQLSTFAENLPGFPDNIKRTNRNTFWIGMVASRNQNTSTFLDDYAKKPEEREMLARTRTAEELLAMLGKYGTVLEMDVNGNIIRSLQDPTGQQIPYVSEANEHEGFLYLGNFNLPYVSRLPLNDTFHQGRFIQRLKSPPYNPIVRRCCG